MVENSPGWVVTSGRADQLADAICAEARCDAAAMADCAVRAASKFDRATAMNTYAALVDELLRGPDDSEQ